MSGFLGQAKNGYTKTVELVNVCWLYLFSCEWCRSIGDMLFAFVLFTPLIPITPFVYLCVAPFIAFIEGTREEEV